MKRLNVDLDSLNMNAMKVLVNMNPGVYTIEDIATVLERSEVVAYSTIKSLIKQGLATKEETGLFKLTSKIEILSENPEEIEVDSSLIQERNLKDKMAQTVINYLNYRTGKSFRFTKQNKAPICSRLREGYSMEDLIHVVDVKCNDWINDKNMSQYLRPSTLFGPKFENYFNSRPYTQNDRIAESMENHWVENEENTDTIDNYMDVKLPF